MILEQREDRRARNEVRHEKKERARRREEREQKNCRGTMFQVLSDYLVQEEDHGQDRAAVLTLRGVSLQDLPGGGKSLEPVRC